MMVAHDNWYLGASITGAYEVKNEQGRWSGVKLAVNFVQRKLIRCFLIMSIDSDRSITSAEPESNDSVMK